MQYFSAILSGWLLSFLGQLPLGTMSITSTQIAVQEDFRKAWQYAFGVALVEVIYLRLVLSGVDWILQHQLFFTILGWLTVVFFLVLGVVSLRAARRQVQGQKAAILNNSLHRFFLGLSMSALNPAQIPFWFIWTSYFLDMHWLVAKAAAFNAFTLGAGVGTVSGLAVYMYGGNWAIAKMKASTKAINTVMAIIFLVAAVAQAWRMVARPGQTL